jgi:hypothetical protein
MQHGQRLVELALRLGRATGLEVDVAKGLVGAGQRSIIVLMLRLPRNCRANQAGCQGKLGVTLVHGDLLD